MRMTTSFFIGTLACFLLSATVARADIFDGLVSYWPLDADLNDVQDDNHGTMMGTDLASSFGAGQFGNGIDLDGIDQQIEITGGDESEFDFTGGDVSISAWVRADALSKNWQAVVAKGEGGGWRIARRGDAPVLSYAGGVGDIPGSALGPDISDGALHHVVAITEGGVSTRLWVDGGLVDTGGVPDLEDRSNRMMIGGNPDSGGRSWDGLIDDVAIWDRVLSEKEVGQLYGSGGSLSQLTPLKRTGKLLGNSTGALLGGTLTDPEGDGEDNADVNYNATFTSTNEPGFGGGEFSFNIFDNSVGGGNAKWCCDAPSVSGDDGHNITAEIHAGRSVLTGFTITSGNDTPGRDPLDWKIQGSHDGVEFTDIYVHSDETQIWQSRDEVRKFDAGDEFTVQDAYEFYRLNVSRTGLTSGAAFQLAELELLGQVIPANLQDVTAPGDAILLVNGTNDGDGNDGPPPGAEGVENAINDAAQKYLNFLDNGSGFIVTPGAGASVANGLRLFTANDSPQRDPASYLLEGASSPEGPFSLISEGDLALPDDRNGSGQSDVDFNQTVFFANVDEFTSYRLTFPTLKDAAGTNSMQIAEVEILGAIVPEPSTFVLAALGVLGIVCFVRRRRSA